MNRNEVMELKDILQYIDIIILALIVIILFFIFRRTLGKKVGYTKPKEEKYNENYNTKATEINPYKEYNIENKNKAESVSEYPFGSLAYNLDLIGKKDSFFSEDKFIDSSKKAFEIILNAFSNDDLEKIKPFLEENVYKHYNNFIKEKGYIFEEKFIKVAEFLVVDINDVNITGNIATIKVKFITEQEREKIGNQRFSEYWTFSKNLEDNVSIWKLCRITRA